MKSMTCREARALFDAALDGFLEDAEREALEKHLADCEACRREYQELSAIHQYMQSLAVSVPEDLHESIMASIKKEPKRRIWSMRFLRPLATAAAAALICIAVVHSPILELFSAKNAMDNAEVAPDMDGNLSYVAKDEALGNVGALEKPDAAPPTESAPITYPIHDSDLWVYILDDTHAAICKKTEKEFFTLLEVTYQMTEAELVLEANGKKESLRLEDGRLFREGNSELLDPLFGTLN